MTQGICPVCGNRYYERRETEIPWEKLNSFGSNSLFGECVRITRGPLDSEDFVAETFGHTAEQTFEYRRE